MGTPYRVCEHCGAHLDANEKCDCRNPKQEEAAAEARPMKLAEPEALAIRWHMGAYDDAARGGSRTLSEAMKKTPLVLALHTADMMATQEEQRRERK